MPVPPTHSGQTSLRWIMAALVAADHIRDLFVVDAVAAGPLNPVQQAAYLLTGFGRTAVSVFFVLSGFFVGGKLLGREALGVAEITRYLADRMTRVYVVLIPALLLTTALDAIGLHYFALYHLRGWSPELQWSVVSRDTAIGFASSLLNTTMYVGPPFGSDAPLWSLAYEWLIYLLFPALLLTGRALLRQRPTPRAAVAGLAIGTLVVLTPGLPGLLAVWLLGFAARYRQERRASGSASPLMKCAIGAAFGCSLAIARSHIAGTFMSDLAVGTATALLCAQPWFSDLSWAKRVQRRLAEFSYSLYVVHFPLALFLLGLMHHLGWLRHQLPPDVRAALLCLALFLAIGGAAYLFSLATERQTPRLRRLMSRQTARPVPVSPIT